MFLFRDHKGGLAESMATAREFKTRGALVDELQKRMDKYGVGEYDCASIVVEPHGYDERIKWDTHVVYLEGYGVFGFTNGAVE